MRITKVNPNIEAMGITQRSLKCLRDTVAEKLTHRIAVVEMPTNDLCCGYLILDWELQSATYSGDGFRMDKAGDGGAGYMSADVLLRLFGIRPLSWEEVDLEPFQNLIFEKRHKEANQVLKQLFQQIADEIPGSDFKRPVDSKPEYVRYGW